MILMDTGRKIDRFHAFSAVLNFKGILRAQGLSTV